MRSPEALREALREAFGAALATLDPARLVRDALPPRPPRRARVRVVAVGKAAPAMARGAFDRWAGAIDDALVVTVDPIPAGPAGDARAAAHPVPDERSVAAACEVLGRASALGTSDLLVALISGGASALLCAPPEGRSLADKQALTAALLDRGASIRDVNLVRRHFSRVKGGRLARAAAPARVLTLAMSDVIGGALHDIGSGPTVPDPTTLAEARAALARAGIAEPPGMSESPEVSALRVRARILAGPEALAHAMMVELQRRGLRAEADPADEGDAEIIAERRVARALTLAPGEAAVIPCEPTLRLPGARGRGGRAGWIALAAMLRLPEGVALMCAASDGVDGSSGAGGALVVRDDGARISAGDLRAALDGFDDASAHAVMGTHLAGGPTGHNLADVHVVARVR